MKTMFLKSAAIATVFACVGCQQQAVQNEQKQETHDQQATQIKLPDGITKIETVGKHGSEIAIPYTKYRLANGLTVTLHKDNSDPLVHVDVTYHVGSGREEPGKSGFAHFFEHMMFQGSENVADEQHFKIITEAGGTNNGTTNSDRTNYYETVPNNQLERVLWLEADRMGFLLNAVTEKKFENQRETVKNERGQRYDNRPYGLLYERVGEALYPEGHPYSWSTIGYIEDLNRADLSDLKKFFLRWYGPNNATLTIGGDIDEEQTLKWVKKYFGGIPPGPKVEDPEYVPVTLDKDRYISMEDNVNLPLIYMAWPTVHRYHPDEAPLDVLMDILGSGKTSLLYKNLVKTGKAVQASAGHGCAELSCSFSLLALPTPGHDLGELEKDMRASLAEFENRGANDDDITRVKAGIVSGMVFGLESVRGKVSQLAAYQTFKGDPDYIKQDIERYENVTKDDVMRVYKKYIKDKPAVIMSIVPKGKTNLIAHKDTWQRYERKFDTKKDMSDLKLRPGTSDFDRSVIPPAGPNPTIHVPKVYEGKLANGIEILGALNDEVPTTTLRLRIPAGQTREPIEKLGLASMTANMLDEDTEKSTAEELSNALNKLGSTVYFSVGDQFSTLYVRTLTKNLDKTLAIAKERLTLPRFGEKDFERLRKQAIETLKNDKKNARTTANRALNKLLFGADNSFAYANRGTIDTLENLSIDDVKDFYHRNYGAQDAEIVVVSDLPKAKIISALKAFDDWQGQTTPEPVTKPFPEIKAGNLYFIDKPKAAQSEIRISKRDLKYDATGEFYKDTIMNYPLGGAFNSRINLNLREDKGYTYGARSTFFGNKLYGGFRAAAGVRADATIDSIRQFRKEISAYQKDGIRADELAFTKSSLGQRDARSFETPSQKLGFLGRLRYYGLKPDYVEEQAKILKDITETELDKLAAKHLKLDEMITIVVGDKEKLLADIKAELGMPIVEIDADGNVVTE